MDFDGKIKIERMPPNVGSFDHEYEDYYWPAHDAQSRGSQIQNIDLPHRITNHVDPSSRGVMISAGANAGYYVKQFARKWGTVYTFEPDPINFMCLCLNTFSLPNVIKFQACLGAKHELVQLVNLHSDDIGGKHVSTITTKGDNLAISGVPTMCIDDLNLTSCDLIQLDVEGYELFALQGAEQTIKQFRPLLCVEFGGDWLGRYVPNNGTNSLSDYIAELGYELIDSISGADDRIYRYKQQ